MHMMAPCPTAQGADHVMQHIKFVQSALQSLTGVLQDESKQNQDFAAIALDNVADMVRSRCMVAEACIPQAAFKLC